MLRRGSFTVASDKDIIEKARNFQTLLERHPEFDRRTKPSHSTSKTTSGPWLDYKARSPEQLQRALNERQKERDKEYGWTQKQVQQLKKEQRRLAEEQERLIKAKERWGSPIGVLPKSDQDSSLPKRDESDLSRSAENLEQLGRRSTNFISPETVISSWQAPEYYLIRELLVHLINNAVDKSEEEQFQKIVDISEFQLKARKQNREERESQQDQQKLANPLSEDLLDRRPAESVCSTVLEPVNCERYILWQMEQIIIRSAETAVVGNRGRDDPAYDLVTGTYHHMVTERQSKRKNIWQHTQLLQTSDAVQPAGALALLDPDTQQLNFLSLRTFDLNFIEDVPAFRIYKHHEIECWKQFTIESTLLNINKKVIGVSAVEVSANQQQIAVGTMKGDIITYSLMQDQPQAVRYIRNESALGDPLISLTWSLDGNRIMNVNDSGMLRVWSTLPGRRLVKDAKELDLVKNTSTDSVPPQLTLLITMDDQENDFNFQAGPLSDTGAQKETDFPSVAAFHPACTLLATQNSIVVGLQSGDLLKCNAVFDTSVESDAAAPNIHFPEISVPRDNYLGQDIRGELFRGHRVPLICVGFISNFDDMVTVDTAGNIFVWKYDRNNLSHFGWFRPHQKYSLFLAERVYEINEHEDKVIYFSDESAAEIKKKKGSELAEIKKKWEKRREAAEEVIVRTKYRRLFLREADTKGNRVTTICEPMVVDGRGSYFHGTIREISTKKLLKHFGQMYKVVKSYCARLIDVKMGPSGTELIFCLLFPPFYPKEPHISFITVRLKPEVKVHDVRIDVLLNENEYFRCLNDNVCQFAVSQVLDASKSSYLFVTLLGSLLIYSRNTRSLLVSSRERDQPLTSVGSLKALQRLNIRSHIRLAHCAGHVQAILFAENDPVVNIFHVTDRNIPEKRRLLYKAYKLWKQTPSTVPVEMTTRRRKYILDRDDCRHVELYVNRLVLQLVDRAVQEVDGEFTEEEFAANMMRDRIAASEYLTTQQEIDTGT
ncbi:uncharacterized protein [Apostichopus japonicus]|uniref:uncharacterized protein n=1 Tax=Stichopus japonicus TaxID=307972 RepID=UPI003AB4CF57